MGALGMALVVGCGGGSDGQAASTSTTVAGAAVKGPMANAEISLYKTNADGTQGAKLTTVPATILSNASGNYSAAITGYTGVVTVEAKAITGTTLYDEATGTTIPAVLGFSLRAVTSAIAGQNITVQLNPFTELATVAALAKTGGLSSTNVAQANKDIREALTFDPLTAAAEFDATSKAPKNALAAALTAISKMAQSSDLGCAGDQAAKVACVTSAIATQGINASAIQVALQTKLDAVVAANGLTTVAITVPSGTPVVESGILAAKALIGTLRSNIKALNADDMSLRTELQAVADDLKNRTAPIGESTMRALNLAQNAAQFYYDVVQNTNAAFVATRSFNGGNNGGCTFYSETTYTTQATSKANALYVACSTTAQFVEPRDAQGYYRPATAVGDVYNTAWTTRVRLHPDTTDSSKFTMYTQVRKAVRKVEAIASTGAFRISSGITEEVRTHFGAVFPGNAANLVLQRDSSGQVNAVNLAGKLAPAFKIGAGSSGYDNNVWRWIPPIATVLGDEHNVTLAATLTNGASGISTLAATGSIDLIKNGALETKLELLAGSSLTAREGTTGSTAQDGSEALRFKFKASTAGSAVAGDFSVGTFAWDADHVQYQPTALAFAGSIQRNGANFFEGTFTASTPDYAAFHANQQRSTTNVEKTKVDFTGKVTIANRPVLNLQLSVMNRNMGSTTDSTIGGQYAQGSVTINMEGTSNATSNILTLISTNGVKLVVDKSTTLYPLTKDGTVVGQFNSSTSRVDYTDRSFEQY